MTSSFHTLFSGSFLGSPPFPPFGELTTRVIIFPSARRNARGHLEPDADDQKVQQSMGFGEYEHAPKVEVRTT